MNQDPSPRVKVADEPKYCQPTLKRGQVTDQKEAKSPAPKSLQTDHHQVSIPSHVYTADILSSPQASPVT